MSWHHARRGGCQEQLSGPTGCYYRAAQLCSCLTKLQLPHQAECPSNRLVRSGVTRTTALQRPAECSSAASSCGLSRSHLAAGAGAGRRSRCASVSRQGRASQRQHGICRAALRLCARAAPLKTTRQGSLPPGPMRTCRLDIGAAQRLLQVPEVPHCTHPQEVAQAQARQAERVCRPSAAARAAAPLCLLCCRRGALVLHACAVASEHAIHL